MMRTLLIMIIVQMASAVQAACIMSDNRPDASCTPGAVMADVKAADICVPGYTAKVRNVPTSIKKQVFAEYGMDNKKAPCPCEVDHLISLELGGSNDLKNLWPEPYENPNGARVKDQVENYLHNQICKGNVDLQTAQKEITDDWQAIYKGMHQ